MSMWMHDEPTRQGAAASRRDSDNPSFRLLVRLQRQNSTFSATKIEKLWRDELLDGIKPNEYLSDVLHYTFTNYWNALRKDDPAPKVQRPSPVEIKQRREEVVKEAKKIVEKIEDAIQVKTLKNFLLPNGQLAWDTPCDELRKYNGFLGQVANLAYSIGKPKDPPSALPLAKLKKIKAPE